MCDPIPVTLLTMKLIANVSSDVAKVLGLSEQIRSIGLLSSDSDDVTYMALDHATKMANVHVVYAKSMYAGAANATTRSAGEVIGILAGPSPSEVMSGLTGAKAFLESGVCFHKANDRGDVVYLSHCVSSCGTYLSEIAEVPVVQNG